MSLDCGTGLPFTNTLMPVTASPDGESTENLTGMDVSESLVPSAGETILTTGGSIL
jgi:hypothetical protein